MRKASAGILLYRLNNKTLEVFLVHPGGPFWKNKDAGAWSIPKGEVDNNEYLLTAAIREFREETGAVIDGNFIELTPVRQKSGKEVHAWAAEGNFDETSLSSNTFEMEWPPRSGKKQSFPEVDRAGWFSLDAAKEKLNAAQAALLTELDELLS